MKDYYALLDVAPTATLPAIKKQYRLLLKIWHPDKLLDVAQKAAAEEKTKGLVEAYHTLADAARRRAYDVARSAARATTQPMPEPTAPRMAEPIEVVLQRREQKLAEVLTKLAEEKQTRTAQIQAAQARATELVAVEAEIKEVEAALAALGQQARVLPKTKTTALNNYLNLFVFIAVGFLLAVRGLGWVLVWLVVGGMATLWELYGQQAQALEADAALDRARKMEETRHAALLEKRAALLEATKEDYMPGLGL